MIRNGNSLVPGRPLGEFTGELPLWAEYRLIPHVVSEIEPYVGQLPSAVWFTDYRHGQWRGALVEVPALGPVIILLSQWRWSPYDPFAGHPLSVIHPGPPDVLAYRATVCLAKADEGEAPASFTDPFWLTRQVA